jgi:hypothetical protein
MAEPAGDSDAVACELGLTRDPPAEKAAAADHQKIHNGTLVRPRRGVPAQSCAASGAGAGRRLRGPADRGG